jgi:hypothetical protein
LAKHAKHGSRSRPQLEAYLTGPEFLASFEALDPSRRLLAIQAVAVALDRLTSLPPATAARTKWTEERKEQLREAARRLPDDRAIARELGLPLNATKVARWQYVGPKRSTPHISRRGPLRIAA